MTEIKNHTHNLDEGIIEYFQFTVKGHEYRFKQPNTEELEELRALREDPAKLEETKKFFYQFITPVSEGAPAFEELAKQFTVPHWRAFNAMVTEEMGIDESIKSPASQ